MAPRNILLLSFWLLAAAICVTYVTVRHEPVAPGLLVSSHQDDVQILRDRPLGSWGDYLPRPILNKQSPPAIAKALEQPTIEESEKPMQVEAPKERRAAPYFPEPRRVARTPTLKRLDQALLGEEPASKKPQQIVKAPKEQRAAPVARAATPKRSRQAKPGEDTAQLVPRPTPEKVGTLMPTTKFAQKKILPDGPKSRFARIGTNRGLGLFALSADFGRPTR